MKIEFFGPSAALLNIIDYLWDLVANPLAEILLNTGWRKENPRDVCNACRVKLRILRLYISAEFRGDSTIPCNRVSFRYTPSPNSVNWNRIDSEAGHNLSSSASVRRAEAVQRELGRFLRLQEWADDGRLIPHHLEISLIDDEARSLDAMRARGALEALFNRNGLSAEVPEGTFAFVRFGAGIHDTIYSAVNSAGEDFQPKQTMGMASFILDSAPKAIGEEMKSLVVPSGDSLKLRSV